MKFAALTPLLLLGACASYEHIAELEPVMPPGPAMNVASTSQPESVHGLLPWLLAYEATGHFAGYSDGEKYFVAKRRARGELCKDDRNRLYRVDEKWSGIYSYTQGTPVGGECRLLPNGAIALSDFGGVSAAAIADAARRLGMTCTGAAGSHTCTITGDLGYLQPGVSPVRIRRVNVELLDGQLPRITLQELTR